MKVFLSADDCKRIAPYVPKELLKDWEWYWAKPYGENTTYAIKQISCGDWLGVMYQNDSLIPALDTQILGEIIRTVSENLNDAQSCGLRRILIIGTANELESRRDAIFYLIENGLIEDAK